jgi:arylsulfatase A-like enzyme
MGYKAVRDERWKYIHYLDHENSDELYDLQSDPYELKNQIGNAAIAAEAERMKNELKQLTAETSAKP